MNKTNLTMTLAVLVCLLVIFAGKTRAFDEHDLKQLQETNKCRNCDLSGAILTGANLKKAILTGANLKGARLNSASLEHADLSNANLSKTDLTHAHLDQANLQWANLHMADLRHSFYVGANFKWADLTMADLRHSDDIYMADLEFADLSYTIWPDGERCAEGSLGTNSPPYGCQFESN
jgi:uncharacterized protein YjbI with pentapeptide repeats